MDKCLYSVVHNIFKFESEKCVHISENRLAKILNLLSQLSHFSNSIKIYENIKIFIFVYKTVKELIHIKKSKNNINIYRKLVSM